MIGIGYGLPWRKRVRFIREVHKHRFCQHQQIVVVARHYFYDGQCRFIAAVIVAVIVCMIFVVMAMVMMVMFCPCLLYTSDAADE